MLPEDIAYSDAQEFVTDATVAGAETNMLFYDGEHWQNGDGWVGPLLNITHPLYADTYQQIQNVFTSQNAIREIVNRETMAAVGEMPHLSILLNRESTNVEQEETPEEKAFVRDATKIFRTWFDDNQGLELLKLASAYAALTASSCLRFYVPFSRMEGGVVPNIEIEQISDVLHLEVCPPFTATVYEDPESRIKVGLFLFTREIEGTEVDLLEKVWVDPETLMTNIEIRDNNDNVIDSLSDFDLRTNITIGMMERPVLITESVRSLQKQLNMVLTMMGRNVTHGGFLERIFFNAQLPGEEVVDPITGEKDFVPSGLTVGPGSTMFVAGVVTTDADGNERVANPSAYYHDPVDTATFITARDGFYQSMLSEVQQAHVEMAAMARVSGESRRQARTEFANQANIPAGQVEVILRWIVKTFFAYLDQFASGSYYDRLTPSVDITLDIGPLPAEEVAELVETYKEGLISLQTAMARYNIPDIQSEIQKIHEQPYQAAYLQTQRSESFLYLVRGGVEPSLAARAAGFSPEMSDEIGTSIVQQPVEQAGGPSTPENAARTDISDASRPNPLKAN